MKKLNSDELFDIFSQQDDHVFADNNMHEEIDNDFITFGTVIAGMRNYSMLDQIYQYRYDKHYDSVRDQLKMKYFNGLMRYASRIDQLHPDTVNDLIDEFGSKEIIGALQQLLDFYEKAEVYENCAIIFNFLQKFQ